MASTNKPPPQPLLTASDTGAATSPVENEREEPCLAWSYLVQKRLSNLLSRPLRHNPAPRPVSLGPPWIQAPVPNIITKLLPVELIYCITDFLSQADILSLSLTCQHIYRICAVPKDKVDPEERAKFLRNYCERDPKLSVLYCHGCQKLHPVDTDWVNCAMFLNRKSVLGRILGCTPIPACALQEAYRQQDVAMIHFHMVHLVMNWHCKGRLSGLPVSRLDYAYFRPWWVRPYFVARNEARHKIVGSYVVQHCECTLKTRRRKNGGGFFLDRLYEWDYFVFCDHFEAQMPATGFEDALNSGLCHDLRFSCNRCYSDYSVDLSPKGWGRWEMVVHAYRAFDGETPDSHHWKVMTGKAPCRRNVDHFAFREGGLREAWHAPPGTMTKEKGPY